MMIFEAGSGFLQRLFLTFLVRPYARRNPQESPGRATFRAQEFNSFQQEWSE